MDSGRKNRPHAAGELCVQPERNLRWHPPPRKSCKTHRPVFTLPAASSSWARACRQRPPELSCSTPGLSRRPPKFRTSVPPLEIANSSSQTFQKGILPHTHLSTMLKKNSEEVTEEVPIQKIPAANKGAVDFLSLIEVKEIKPCLFEESLVAISENGETIGTFSISVEWACYSPDGWNEEDCYLVRANSKGTIDGIPCTTSITGYITKRLETVEQHTKESVRFTEHPVETRTHVVKRQGQLFVSKTVVERDEEIHVGTFSYKCAHLHGLVSDSANLLVLRLMARRQTVPQDAIFLSFDTDQHICTSTYSALGFQKQQVGNEEVDVFVIERAVHSMDEVPLSWQFYFLSDGHLSRRVQVGSPATMVILQMPILIDTDEPDPRPVFKKIPLDWEEDVELYSKFLDRKEELQASHATYVRRHPELNALLADFLQLLLLRKPVDVVTFAAEFFAPFSAQRPPCRSFQSSDKPSPFRSHV
ncbi:ciliogenesis-associated TTC17-interacting protein isoform X2 [Rhineura floridana]|uniref:ciliogenesis-associated TTC17-interacting protein isoform X2 n=1 Tax=Rhineura floridana TaxID=261503 RepID=UPI002AC8367E|nr:ciliogenesis-associated TTC17-interacting protein isoform X2 [Rhineura floridana]